jgi:hypothetical protein
MGSNKDYRVLFGGAVISRLEANKVGLATLIGFIGAILSFFVFGLQNKLWGKLKKSDTNVKNPILRRCPDDERS